MYTGDPGDAPGYVTGVSHNSPSIAKCVLQTFALSPAFISLTPGYDNTQDFWLYYLLYVYLFCICIILYYFYLAKRRVSAVYYV